MGSKMHVCMIHPDKKKKVFLLTRSLLRHVRQGCRDRTEAIHYKIHNNTLHSPTHNEQHGEINTYQLQMIARGWSIATQTVSLTLVNHVLQHEYTKSLIAEQRKIRWQRQTDPPQWSGHKVMTCTYSQSSSSSSSSSSSPGQGFSIICRSSSSSSPPSK